MKTTILSFLFLLLLSVNSFSQNYIFKMYRFECSELFGITLKKPKGFKVVDGLKPYKIDKNKTIGTFYRMALQSKNKDCLVLFPWFVPETGRFDIENMTFAELKAALKLNIDDKTLEIDTVKYVKTFAAENMDNYFNADTVFVCQIPLIEPYREIYNYCTGINMLKEGHPPAMMKVFFTEEGKKKEEEYVQTLFKSIHYGDVSQQEYDQGKYERTRKKFKRRFILYRKKNKPTYFDW